MSPLLLAVFRDDMLDRRMVPAADYYDGYVQVQPGEEVEILERVTATPSRIWLVNQPSLLIGYQFCSRSAGLLTRRA